MSLLKNNPAIINDKPFLSFHKYNNKNIYCN